MSELFTGDGQSPLGDLSGTSELEPPIFAPTPITGTTDFDYSGGVGTQAGQLSLRGAGNQAMAGHVLLVQEVGGADPYIGGSVITARRTRVGSLGTHTELDQTFSRSWTDPLVDVGQGELKVMEDDPDLSGFVFDGNDVIQFSLNGQLAYAIVVEEPVRTAISPGEQADQGWVLGGRGHLSLLERALVYPTNGIGKNPPQEDRIFNFTDPHYDDSAWTGAHIVTYILWVQPAPYGAEGQWGLLAGSWDVNFSDQTAAILWSSAGTIVNAPVGKVYGRQWFFMSAADDHAYFQGEADNACDFYLNGQLILSTTNYATRNDADISIPAGWNLLATVCENRLPVFPGNPAGWAWATWDYGYPPDLYAHSDASCKILAYPATVPSMTVGKVMRLALQEAQARGALSYITLAFTDTHDSGGRLWPTPEISTKVGTDLLTFFSKEIGETYADLYMPPGSTTLYAWNKGTRGGSSGLTLAGSPDDATPGNLTALVQTVIP